ncbi:MAG: hypothetical protein WCH32_01775 [Pseudomonadota bacterium]
MLASFPRLAAALLLALPLTATAAPLSGRLAAPAGAAPALTVYAWSLTRAHLYSVATSAGQATYTIDVPPGRYWLFAAPAEPGAPQVYGAHTEFVSCSRSTREPHDCSSHGLRAIASGSGPLGGIDLTDWHLDDATTRELDHLLGRADGEVIDEAELAAPKFSEYPAAAFSGPHAATLLAGEPRSEHESQLAAALTLPPNFAGRVVLQRIGCGPGCEGIALVDAVTGRVSFPPALAELPGGTACSTRGPLVFRRDSRLLTVTGRDRNELVTRYYVWDADSGMLRPVAALASALGERCGQTH